MQTFRKFTEDDLLKHFGDFFLFTVGDHLEHAADVGDSDLLTLNDLLQHTGPTAHFKFPFSSSLHGFSNCSI